MKKFSLAYKIENGEAKVTRFMEGSFKISEHIKICKAMLEDVITISETLLDSVERQEEAQEHIKKIQDNASGGIVKPASRIIL